MILIYTGPYEGLMQATADLLAWAEKKGVVWDKWPAGSKGEGWRARIENYEPRLQGGLYGCRPEGAGQRQRSGERHKT
jgi:hypothetical protein